MDNLVKRNVSRITLLPIGFRSTAPVVIQAGIAAGMEEILGLYFGCERLSKVRSALMIPTGSDRADDIWRRQRNRDPGPVRRARMYQVSIVSESRC